VLTQSCQTAFARFIWNCVYIYFCNAQWPLFSLWMLCWGCFFLACAASAMERASLAHDLTPGTTTSHSKTFSSEWRWR